MIDSLDSLLTTFKRLHIGRVLCKRLAENDNSKQQIYLGGSFESLNLLPFGSVRSEKSAGTATMKATMKLAWLDDHGQAEEAPGAQLILYPGYPEVRFSGFLRGCKLAPSESLRPIPSGQRRFNNGPDGRILFFGIHDDRSVLCYLAVAGSRVARDFERLAQQRRLESKGVFFEIPLVGANAREVILQNLRRIHAAGWHQSCRLTASGQRIPYAAPNGAGYTLEALFGITPNGRSDADYQGWELKAYSTNRITLMTPEPDYGWYRDHGVEAFVRRYGHRTSTNSLYFTGMHRVGEVCEATGQRLELHGYDAARRKIIDVSGGIVLIADDGSVSAGWSFGRLLEHWGRKHAAAAYVPYEARESRLREYRFKSPAQLGEGTDFVRFLQAMADGLVFYDPGSKVTDNGTGRARTKARSQFRMGMNALIRLYEVFNSEPL